MLSMLSSVVLVSVAFLLKTAAQTASTDQAGTVASFLIKNDWRVESSGSQTCSQATCCCFTGPVNIYPTYGSGELNVNGTVAGSVCDLPVKQDNLDPPSGYTFTQEFFGIDSYTFTLANATYGGVSGWSVAAVATKPSCSFNLFRASNVSLPGTPLVVPVTTAPVLPAYDQTYAGTWNFDSTTCQVSNSSCCCLVGSSTIFKDPDGTFSFFVSGPPSIGCRVPSGELEQDDFPWPTSGTATASSVTVNGFLENQDNYQITISQPSSTQLSLYFQDMTNPLCSMKATRSTSAAVVTTTAPTVHSGAMLTQVSFLLVVCVALVSASLLI